MKRSKGVPFALMPLVGEESERSKPFFTWDIETSNWTKLVVVGLYAPKVGFRYFEKFGAFLEFVRKEFSGYDGFAHFGGRYDHLFLIQAVLEDEGERFQITEMIPRGSGIYMVEITFDDEEKIQFYDSSALLPFGLRRITKEFGVTHVKKEIDYSKISRITSELLDYLKSDCLGLYEALEKLFSWPLIKRAGRGKSLASQALRVLRTTIETPVPALSRSWDSRIRGSYFGGRTEIFRCVFKGHRGKKLKCYDVNSLYPYVMREFEYPGTPKFETDEFHGDELGFWNCKVSIPEKTYLPPLGILHNKKFLFPTGNFSAYLTTAEIHYVKKTGGKVKVEDGTVFSNRGFLFRRFVDCLYEIREAAPKGSIDNTVAKLLLNSCYGRFGLNHEKSKIIFDDGRIGLRLLGGRETIIRANGKEYRLMEEDTELSAFSNVAIAASVTANARMYMHGQLSHCGEDIYYTDTDSLFTSKDLPTGNGLGELKLEYECESAVFLLPKTYIAGEKITMKGFDKKKISDFTFDDFYECLRGDLKRLKINQEPKFATFKTAVRKGELVTMTKASTREIRSQYDKRIILKTKDWNTKPIHIEGK